MLLYTTFITTTIAPHNGNTGTRALLHIYNYYYLFIYFLASKNDNDDSPPHQASSGFGRYCLFI